MRVLDTVALMRNGARPATRIVLVRDEFDQAVAGLGLCSQDAIADALGIHPSTVARMRARETGVSSEMIFHISAVLKRPIEQLFQEEIKR